MGFEPKSQTLCLCCFKQKDIIPLEDVENLLNVKSGVCAWAAYSDSKRENKWQYVKSCFIYSPSFANQTITASF